MVNSKKLRLKKQYNSGARNDFAVSFYQRNFKI